MDAQPDPAAAADPVRVSVLRFDRVRDGHECRLYDPHGRLVAVLVGHLDPNRSWDDAFDFYARARRGELLPVRAEPEPTAQPDPAAQPEPVAVSLRDSRQVRTGLLTPFHRHPHTDPYAPSRVVSWHEHRHSHRGSAALDVPGDADSDAALHDHEH